MVFLTMKKSRKLKITYSFDPTIKNWQERLDLAFNLVFKKMEEKYEGEKKEYGSKYI